MGPTAKFLRLSWAERRLVIEAVCVLALTRLGLFTLPFRTVRWAAARLAKARKVAAGPGRPSAESISWAVAAAGSHLPGGRNCLAKALAAEVMLGHFGYSSRLKIGVAKEPSGRFEAHAWLESEGKVLVGGFCAGRYVELRGPGADNL